MQNAIVNVNGQILSPSEATSPELRTISVFDRAYLYGDSLYEVVRSYEGKFYLLDEHLERLQKSAELCRMVLDQSLETYKEEILKTHQAFQKHFKAKEAYARIIVSRGIGKIGFAKNCVGTPTQFTVILTPLEPPTAQQFEEGMKLQVVRRLRNDPRALSPAMKSGNYLNSLLAYLEANDAGFTDALLCNSEGHLTEGTTFNIFYIRRGIIATPPLDIGILDGITRRRVFQLAEQAGIPCREVRFPKERLLEADEVFVSSSIREVFPVTQVDEVRIGDGTPGPITRQLNAAYREGGVSS